MSFQHIYLRDVPHEFIITAGSGVLPSDLSLFFDFNLDWWHHAEVKGLTLMHYQHFDTDQLTWEELAVALQLMPSKGQARKNGWSGSVPFGYIELKRKFHRFHILNLNRSFDG